MRGELKLIVAVGLVLSSALLNAAPVRAELPETNTRAELSMRKLGRGLANLVTAVFEIPRKTTQIAEESGWMAGSTIGLAQGVWLGCLRAVTGAFEIITFPLEIPKDYGPLLEPEFVFEGGLDYAK